jgi:hypothetical protein
MAPFAALAIYFLLLPVLRRLARLRAAGADANVA